MFRTLMKYKLLDFWAYELRILSENCQLGLNSAFFPSYVLDLELQSVCE